MGPIRTFLKAVERLARNGDISIDDAYRFAKQQFGEVSDLMKLQINKLFKQKQAPGIKKQKEGEVIEVSFKPGKSKYRDKEIEESPSQASGVGLESLKNPFRTGGGLDPLEGMTRTAARVVLNRRGIDIPERADAIDIFEENFGGDALMDLKNVADELLEKETTGNITESMGKFLEMEGMFDLKINKDAPKALSNKELLDLMEEAETEDILKKFDPKDREPNAMGGINRTSFALGGMKALMAIINQIKKLNPMDAMKEVNKVLAKEGKYKNLSDAETKKIFDDTQDHIFERDVKPKETDVNFDLEEGLNDLDNLNLGSKKGDVVSKQLKIMRLAEDIEPGLFEKLNDKQLDIIVKYGDRIDQDLLKNIVLDPDPSNQAAAIATLDEVETMIGKGMSQDEIMSVLQSTPRRKQAEGGLSYLMGM